MLILAFINFCYLQNIVFSFEEGSNGQNQSLSDSQQPKISHPPTGEFSPLKNSGDGSIYIPSEHHNFMLMIIL